MNTLKKEKILGFPIWMYLILVVVMMVFAKFDLMLTDMIGCLCFALIVGTMIGWIGDHIPIWNKWLGGGMVLASLVASAFATYGIVSDTTIDALKNFNSKVGFQTLYILVVITGAVLSIDRKQLLRSFAGYLPTVLGGIICALLLCGLVGAVTGVGFIDSIADFGLPIMGGGNGGGIAPMSKMWAAAKGLGQDAADSWWATAFATISLGNIIAIFFSAIVARVGEKIPGWYGNGQLMKPSKKDLARLAEAEKKGEKIEKEEEKIENLDNYKLSPADYATGLALGLFCYGLATFYADKVSIINHLDLGFSIHGFAFLVILVAILNISGILPINVRAGARGVQLFFVKYISFALMITTGIGSKLSDFAKAFASPANLLCIIFTVFGSMVGTFLIGKLFRFYPVEGMVTAGLCMANGGGAGDVMCLGAAKRMNLLSFAQMSTRIGGALMLVIASIFFGLFVH